MKARRSRSLNLVRKPIPILSESKSQTQLELSRADVVEKYLINSETKSKLEFSTKAHPDT